MPEDTPKTAETEAVQDFQPPPSVITIYDGEGREHFAAGDSKFVVDGLAKGQLTMEPLASKTNAEEVPHGSESGSAGENQESGGTDGSEGSGNGSADPSGSRRGRRTGSA